MGNILQIETAAEVCSVSIASEGNVLVNKETKIGRSHAAVLSVYIQDLFNETGFQANNLDAVAVSIGPGSYTGLRIGVSTAKGLCYGADLPLIAIPTLESMCYGLIEKQVEKQLSLEDEFLLAPMIDARRMEVYTAVFSKKMEQIEETFALVADTDSFSELLRQNNMAFFGDGADKLTETIKHPNAIFVKEFNLSSTYMTTPSFNRYRNKEFEDIAYFEPYYLKDFITTVPKKKIW